MKTLFITGGSGFIGRHLMRRINCQEYKKIYCLSRSETLNIPYQSECANVNFIQGSILEATSYQPYLADSDVVIHLAAVTGKAKPEEYFLANTQGTEQLIDQCKRLGNIKFLYISSIAANFKETRNYPYAQSKQKAEQIVKAGGIDYTIIRPTIVIGHDSPILISLMKLAKAPVVPIFGNGSVKIQPIYLEDFISCILYVVANDMFDNSTWEIGGPEYISIERFLVRLHAQTSIRAFRPIHIPIRPVTWISKFLENWLLSFLPFTAGQLASFANDGTIAENALFDQLAPTMTRIDQMIQASLSPGDISKNSTGALEIECERFTMYLIGCKPDNYINQKYAEGHKATKLGKGGNRFDTLLIKIAKRNMLFTKLTDVYTRVFYRNAVVRKKLVLLLAILEGCSMTSAYVDSVSESSISVIYLKLLAKAFLFILLFFVSVVAFAPFHALTHLSIHRFGKNL